MKHIRMFWLGLLIGGAFSAGGRIVRAQPAPSLTAEKDRAVSLSRGSTAQSFQIASAILKETRRIYIVLPASFSRGAPERKYPVTIVLDGEDNVPPVVAASDELSRNGQIPESVIVAIPNVEGSGFLDSMRKRVRDLTPPGLSVSGSSLNEGGDRFLDFIEKELLPAVESQFRGGLPRTFIGHSNGGILATYVAATRPGFRAVIAIDTPTELGDNWLFTKLMARAASATPEPVRYASYEARFRWRNDTWQKLVAAAPSSWKLHREHLARESHESLGMLAMYLGLREVFSDYSLLAAPVAPTTSILPYYEKVSAAFGASLIPPRRLLRTVVEDLLMEGRGADARKAYNTLVTGYGQPSDSARMLAEIAEVERRPPPSETVEALLANPFPSPAEAKNYLGDWAGETWPAEPGAPRSPQLLHVRVVDGRVVGETEFLDAPPEYRLIRWDYLRITPAGMTWGFMNGMRPRGVILHEGKLEGDKLTGEDRFGGMNVRNPDGTPREPWHFWFKRVAGAK